MTLVLQPAFGQQPASLHQSATTPESVTFTLDRHGLPVPSFDLKVNSDGSAIYHVFYPPEVPKFSPYAATQAALPPTEVTLHTMLTPATTARLFDQVRGTGGFRNGCASKAKNIADTGAKTLTYLSPAGKAECTFNYTEDKTIQALNNTFQSIALTLDEGRRLEEKHRFDRLALDPESYYLVKMVKEGRASELLTIAPILQSLVDDPQVLERVRSRAAKLLEQATASR